MTKNLATNKSASFHYFLEESIESGIVLMGSEMKPLRSGKVNIEDGHCEFHGNELFIHNMYIGTYDNSNRFNHETRRNRKLLLHKSQLRKLLGKVKQKGYTIIPIRIFLDRKYVKMDIALAKGKKLFDKREVIAKKEWQREKQRELKHDNR